MAVPKGSQWYRQKPAAFGDRLLLAAISLTFALLLPVAARAQSHSGVDLEAIDKTVDPCTDFYHYACGAWLKANPIPPEEAAWGRFDVLAENNQKTLRGILENAAEHPNQSAIKKQVGEFYQSCMNEDRIEQLGAAPLQPELRRISEIRTRADLLAEIVRLHERQVQVFFNLTSAPDPNDAKREIADLDQDGLGLPERDFYFGSDPSSQEIRRKYVTHIGKMLALAGADRAASAKEAAEIMRIETALAKASLDVTARRDPKALVHPMSVLELTAQSPAFSFTEYFKALHTPPFDRLNVAAPAFQTAFNTLLQNEPIANLKSYLAWHYISASAHLLTRAFVNENFEFYDRTLTGTSQLRPRWKRCVSATDEELGDALGQLFVEKTHAELGKTRTLQMVIAIEEQMRRDINSTSWMTPVTKKRALEKLALVTNKIGYPGHWRDYSSVRIQPDDFFVNWYRANEFESRREIAKIGKPADRSDWEMTPPTVNAYYQPAENNINFPAGILAPPFYSNEASDAVNYGAVGAVIGHELTHGFDDEGRQYDGNGNLKDWWTKADRDRFARLSDCLKKEYSRYKVAPGVDVNGQLTLGENTADNGGIRLAYVALLDDLTKKAIPANHLQDGYTQTQQFFLGFAQVWCENERPEAERLQVETDPHAPSQFRVDGTLSNMPEFGKAFGCKSQAKMVAPKACRIW